MVTRKAPPVPEEPEATTTAADVADAQDAPEEVDAPEAEAANTPSSPPNTSSLLAPLRKKTVWIPVVAVLTLMLIGSGGLFFYQQYQQKQAEAARAAAATEQTAEKKLVSQFDAIMVIRSEALAAEAQASDAVSQADQLVAAFDKRVASRDKKVKELGDAYQKEYDRVTALNNNYYRTQSYAYPDSPDYPDVVPSPNFQAQIQSLKGADTTLRAASAKLSDLEVDDQFTKTIAQLKEAIAALAEESLHNADVLSTSVEPPSKNSDSSESNSYIDMKIFGTLRADAAKAVFILVNDDLGSFVKKHDLDIRLYDLAGGRDISDKDSSMLASSAATATP